MTNKKLQKPIRKFLSSKVKRKVQHCEQSEGHHHSGLCKNSHSQQEGKRNHLLFHKNVSKTGLVFQNSRRHRRSRIFKHVRKKKRSDVQIIGDDSGDFCYISGKEPFVCETVASGELKNRKNYKMEAESQRHSSRKKRTFSALKRAVSLRLKSRKDSQSEKVDLSSLVRLVDLNSGTKVTSYDATEVSESIRISGVKTKSSNNNNNQKSERTRNVKENNNESNILSPTCGDMYGTDEDESLNCSFQNNAISERVTKKNKEKLVSSNYGSVSHIKTADIHECISDNSSEQCEVYSNLTFHLTQDSKSHDQENSVLSSHSSLDISDDTKKINTEEIPLFKSRLGNSSCNIVIEDFENPWVLQSKFEVHDKKISDFNRSLSNDGSVVYESLGFSVNNLELENSLLSPKSAKKKNIKPLRRSKSIESLDSFNSSIHSLNSEECFFSSDSDADVQADEISLSSSNSFVSAKDYNEQNDLGDGLIEKLKRSSSLDSLNKSLSADDMKIKPADSFDALDNTTPVANSMKHTYSVDDVHRIIQRPSSLSFVKGFSLDSASKSDKTPKSEKKKEKNKRRSLDSSFKTVEIKSDFKAELEKQNLKSASSDSGLSSVLSPVQENGDVKLRSNSKMDASGDKMYYTLPNPRKIKSFPPLLPKKKVTRIGSLSKMFSEKAESLTGLKLTTSFKLRNLEKPIASGLNKTRSLTTLMSKKGSAMVSSISTYIKGKSTSETNLDMVDSPFKPKARKAAKLENDDSVFVYEKVKVLVPRKRRANKQEQAAERKRLTLDLKLSSIKQIGLDSASANDKKNLSGSKLVSPSSSSSINSVECPTMLDELMKSVDTRRFSLGLALDMENMSDTEQDETSSKSSSLGLLSKKQSIVSDLTTPSSVFASGGDYFQMCEKCRKMRFCLDRNFELDVLNPVEKKCQSLYNLNSFCACSGVGNSCDTSPSVGRRELYPHESNKNMEDDVSSTSSPILKRQTSISLQELRQSKSLPFQSYVCKDTLHDPNFDSGLKETPNIKARRCLPYSLTKYEPCLDLSADDIDEIGSIDNGSDGKIYERNVVEKSHSCSDLLDKSNDISFITEPDMYSSTGKRVERKPSKRGDRPVKVKSLSSSHDALTCFTAVDIPDKALSAENIEGGHEFVKPKVTITKESEDSSDSGNEDYHSVGSEADKIDCSSGNLNKTEQHSMITEDELQVSALNIPDYSSLPNAFQNIDLVCEMCKEKKKNASCASGGFNNVKYELNKDKPAFEGTQDHELVSEQFKGSECYEVGNQKFIEFNQQKHRPLTLRRKFLSVSDMDMHDCDKKKLNGLRQKSLSNSKLYEFEEGKCSNGRCSETVTHVKLPFQSEKVKTNANLGTVANADSGVLHTNVNTSDVKDKFLFDDQMVKTYKKTQNVHSLSRLKSISSDDVHVQPYLDTKNGFPTHSLSLNKLNQKNSPNYTHDKLCIDQEFFPPNLSPLNCVPGLPPFHGFSAFSPQPDDDQLPEFEEVYKYDICLGYLVHSITCDNKTICVYSLQRNKQLMEGVITPISGLPGAPHTRPSESSHGKSQKTQQKVKNEDLPNPAAPITVVPSEKLSHAGHVLRTVLLSRASHMIRDRKFHLRTYRRCMVGTEMVDWLLQQSSLVHSRTQAVGMWQALVEEGVIVHVCHEHQFKDKYLFYRFREDDQGVSTVPSNMSKKECEDELQEIFLMLAQIGPDAMMRMILRKLPHERTVEDLEIIYEELLHIKALSHLSTMVKRELASVLVFESHAKSGTVLFNQGDEGKSWYIILKGSVNVVIYGKGVVCTLHEGDDFGKLALVNDAPRAATIVLRDDNCHFLRVDKDDFNRILRDVEANTVRLKEHGQDVLVLEKIPTNTQSADGTIQAHYKYSIMAGTPEKMLEHLLETRLDNKGEEELGMYRDGFLEDFLLTHVIFMPCNHLCPVLLSHYHSSMSDSTEQENFEFMLNHKKCVLHFVQEWSSIVGNAFREDHTINAFLEELHSCVLEDQQSYISLREDADALENIIEAQGRLAENQLLTNSGTHPPLTRKTSKDNMNDNTKRKKVMKAADENIFKVYCADHTYCTLRLPMDTTVEQILSSARDKLCLGDDLVLCEVKSTGERITFKENDLCVTSGLSINGRLFITPREHQDALTPLPEQDGPSQGSVNTIELVSSREMAYYMTLFDWDLFSCVQEYELIYQVFGRYKFRKITANLDLFLRRFNEIQFWVVTEMVLTTNLSKRVALLRKFIKLASYCKDFQNLNSFFAIVMGLSNIAVSRLSQTWEKLPGKFKKMFADFETLMDPSRNHRVYRLSVAKMVPPIIPFMPLLMKDMRFTHDGNKTYFDGLVNFEKMHMIAQTLKTVRFCRSSPLELEPPSSLKSADISQYIRNLQVIDNQKHLDQISHKLEPRKT